MADDADFAGDVIKKQKISAWQRCANSLQDQAKTVVRTADTTCRQRAAKQHLGQSDVCLAPVFTRKNKHTDAKGKS